MLLPLKPNAVHTHRSITALGVEFSCHSQKVIILYISTKKWLLRCEDRLRKLLIISIILMLQMVKADHLQHKNATDTAEMVVLFVKVICFRP